MFIKNYIRLNHIFVRNIYPLPRIDKTIKKLEGFQYVTALDINIIYYPIRRSSAIQDMMTLVT